MTTKGTERVNGNISDTIVSWVHYITDIEIFYSPARDTKCIM